MFYLSSSRVDLGDFIEIAGFIKWLKYQTCQLLHGSSGYQ